MTGAYLRWAIGLWVVGLLTAVPWATWHLLFHAPREQYALLIVGILFWLFGYWAVVMPLLGALKVRALYLAVSRLPADGKVLAALRHHEAEAVVVDLIATENGVPRALAQKAYRMLVERLAQDDAARDRAP